MVHKVNLIACVLILLSLPALGQSWDARQQFSGDNNPNGVWVYGSTDVPGDAVAPFTQKDAGGWYASFDYWCRVVPNDVTSLFMHPSGGGVYSVVQWTSPVAGPVSINGRFFAINTSPQVTTTDAYVYHNNSAIYTTLVDGNHLSNSFSLIETVAQNDTIDFIVGWGPDHNYAYDGTGLEGVITVIPALVATPTFSPDGGYYTTAQSVTISCATPGATIRYTIDGSDPTESSPVYSAPIAVSGPLTLKAKAWKTGNTPSLINTADYVIGVPTPVFTPDAGSFADSVSVAMSCSMPGATIYYTTDGTSPTSSSPVYTSPLLIDRTTTLTAGAYKDGYWSQQKAADYTKLTGPVTWDLAGDWAGGVTPAMGIGPDWAWSYGWDTDGSGTLLSPFSFRAYAEYGGWILGDLGYDDYTYTGGLTIPGITKRITASQPAGIDWPLGTVAMHTPTGPAFVNPAIVRWTARRTMTINLSGSVWKAGSQGDATRAQVIGMRKNSDEPYFLYDTLDEPTSGDPFTFWVPGVQVVPGDTIDLFACNMSGVGAFIGLDWTITEVAGVETVGTPVISPPAGAYSTPQSITMSCPTQEATIRYTTDGSDPSATSPVYSSSLPELVLNGSQRIKAQAFKVGLMPSGIAQADYVTTTDASIGQMKDRQENSTVGCASVVVTAAFGSEAFYVEEIDRSSGIRVQMPSNGVAVGSLVDVGGILRTDADTGEKYIEAVAVPLHGLVSPPMAPLGVINRSLGGLGIPGAPGLSNIGLLVNTWGRITSLGQNRYKLSDGSGVDVVLITSSPIMAGSPAAPAPDGTFVTTDGISTSEKDAATGAIRRVVRSTDVRVEAAPAP